MKKLIQITLLIFAMPCWAQPTGSAKIYLEITDNGDTLHFENGFKKNEYNHKTSLRYKSYKLEDVSDDQTGFRLYPKAKYIHKTIMTQNHQFHIVKNKNDTMRIEILNAYNVYFLSIPFQKGNFRMIVNDGHKNKWAVNTLPYKKMDLEQLIFNLTPKDWSPFQVVAGQTSADYTIQTQFKKQGLLVQPVLPEDDPNFRNRRRINYLRLEVDDYNFDGQKDYRERKWNDSTKWNYFIYKDSAQGFVLDTLLSSLDKCTFYSNKKMFLGVKTTQVDAVTTQMETYEYINGAATLVLKIVCVQDFPNAETKTCTVSGLENGKWVDKEPILGPE